MATAYETPPSALSLPELSPVAATSLTGPQAKAFEELKALCERNKLYWPVSKLEGKPAEGANGDIDLLYAFPLSIFLGSEEPIAN
jgi:hypothetical protein